MQFKDQGFPSVKELLDYLVKNQVPVTKERQAILVTPVKKKDEWEMCREDIVLLEEIGKSNIARVLNGVLKPSNNAVAVEVCNASVSQDVKKQILVGAEILKRCNHPNIVRLIGLCTQQEPVFIGNFKILYGFNTHTDEGIETNTKEKV